LRLQLAALYALCIVGIFAPHSPFTLGQETRATRTSINGPSDIALDGHGHLYVLEFVEDKVLRIDLKKGTLSTVAGNGKDCCYRDGARATDVSLEYLRSLAVDDMGNVFLGNGRQIERVDAITGLISILAGDGQSGETQDGAKALSAHFWQIDGLAVDANEDLFFVDGHQGKIFKLDLKSGTVRLYAGGGGIGYSGDGGPAIDAGFHFPDGISIDSRGNLIVADSQNCRIRRIDRTTGVITSVAVTGGFEDNCRDVVDNSRPGPFPSNPVSDSRGNVYFVEGAMDVVLRVDAVTSHVSQFAGNGKRGFKGDLGPASNAELGNPSGLAIDADGNIFVSEYVNNRVRRIDAKTKIITTVAGNGLPHRMDVQM